MSTEPHPKSYDDDSLNFKKLEKELHAAVDADKRYWTENDAKFRAVNQKVESYEEFQDIVKASHLKPLEKGDNLNNVVFDQPWNSHAMKMKNAVSVSSTKTEIKQSDAPDTPKNGQEFVRDWRRHHKTTASQYSYLLKIGGLQLGQIFKTEIGFGLLGDMLIALCKEFSDSDCCAIVEILDGLSSANRFSLSVQFLSSKEKQVCRDLIEKLKTAIVNQNDIDKELWQEKLTNLEVKYEMKKS